MQWVNDNRLKNRCIELILSQASSAFFSSALAGSVLIAAFWGRVSHWVMAFWLVSYFSLVCIRLWLAARYKQADTEGFNPDRWFIYYAACILASGLVWGVFILLLAPAAEGVHAAVLMVTFTALLAGAVTAYSVSFPLYICFSLPAVSPLLVSLMISNHEMYSMLAVIILCWYLFMVSTARRFSDSAMRALGYQYENMELVRELEAQNHRAERLADELLVLSHTDALTGLYNRRYFDEKIAREWNRSLRTGHPLSLVLCDIDFFKGFNDALGHPEGDRCIRLVAGVLKEAVREGTDFAVRYGGEEFALVLANTAPQDAVGLAERLRLKIEELEVPHPASSVSNVVTASFGVSGVTAMRPSGAVSLVSCADKALYEAKAGGRNQVCLKRFSENKMVEIMGGKPL